VSDIWLPAPNNTVPLRVCASEVRAKANTAANERIIFFIPVEISFFVIFVSLKA